MSAYGHEMEQRLSAHSLSGGGGSEMESGSFMESGFFVTSFAATIFIAGLVAVGMLLITLLIALSVMLQSCQNKSGGVIEHQEPDDYSHCRTFYLHSELNSLGMDELPSNCWDFATHYMSSGQYARDLESTVWVVENYLCRKTRPEHPLAVVLMDIDDVLFSNTKTINFYSSDCHDAKALKQMSFLRLYMRLKACGWPLILLSRKPEVQQNATIEHLISAGYEGWSRLIMRLEDEKLLDSHNYFSGRQAVLKKDGFHVAGIVSSQMDAFAGPQVPFFKLPNPLCHIEETSSRKESVS